MRRAWFLGLTLALGLPACVRTADLDLALAAIMKPDTKLVILGVGKLEENGGADFFAFDPRAPFTFDPRVEPESARFVAITYPFAHEELGLPLGWLTPADAGVTALRALPSSRSTSWIAPLREGPLDWALLIEWPPALANFRIAPLDLAACLERGGCLADRSRDPDLCTLPCPEPPVPVEPMPPEPPALPAPAVLLPCPTGWSVVTASIAEALDTCEPPAAPLALNCAPYEAQFFREPGCTRIGTECPADGWPPELGGDPAPIYVRGDAAPGGDGTRARPLRTIDEAIAFSPGADIALYAGEVEGPAHLDLPVRITGACTERSAIVYSGPVPTEAAVEISSPGVALANLSVKSTTHGVFAGVAGAGVRLDDVAISGPAGGQGLTAIGAGAFVSGRNVVVRDFGTVGISSNDSAVADLERVVVEHNGQFALHVSEATARFRDVAARDTYETVAGTGHPLIMAGVTSSVTVERGSFERGGSNGVRAARGARLSLTDVEIRDILPDSRGLQGEGLAVVNGAQLIARGLLIERVRAVGLSLSTASATVSGALIRDVYAASNDELGIAVVTARGTELRAERMRVDRVATGLYLDGDTRTVLRDVVLQHVEPLQAVGGVGAVSAYGQQDFERFQVRNARAFGVAVSHLDGTADPSLSLRDATLLHVSTNPAGDAGLAVVASGDVTMALDRVRVERAGLVALGMAGPVRATVNDFSARDCGGAAQLDDAAGGVAVIGSALELRRASFDHMYGRAVGISGHEAQATIADVSVTDEVAYVPDGNTGVLFFEGFQRVALARASVLRATAIGLRSDDVIAFDASDVSIREGGGIRTQGGMVTLARVRLIDNTGDALHAKNAITSPGEVVAMVVLEDATIEGTRDPGMNDDAAAGAGLHAEVLTWISASRFRIRASAGPGALLDQGAELDLQGGEIRGNHHGVEIANPSFDRRRLLVGVVYDDNGGADLSP